jgi:hypothetical protein
MIGCSKTWMFCGWNENLFELRILGAQLAWGTAL